jgi:hypothetical protein
MLIKAFSSASRAKVKVSGTEQGTTTTAPRPYREAPGKSDRQPRRSLPAVNFLHKKLTVGNLSDFPQEINFSTAILNFCFMEIFV